VRSSGVTQRRSLMLFASVTLLAGAVLTACGSSSKPAATSPSSVSPTSAAAAPSGTPIKIMLMGLLSGSISEPEIGTAGKAAVATVNASGGINGHPLQLVLCDDMGNPNLNAACGRTAISDGVVAVVGSLSLDDQNILPILAAANIADIGMVAVAPQDSTSANAFPVDTTPAADTGIGADLSAKAGCKTAADITFNISATLPYVNYVEAGFAEYGGNPKMRIVAVAPTTTDFTAAMATATAGGNRCVALGMGGAATTEALIAAQKLGGLTVATDAAALSLPAVAALNLPSGMLYLTSVFKLPGTGTSAADAFVTATKAIDPSVNANTDAENSYDGVLTFAQIAKGLPSVTALSVLNAMKASTGVNTGLTGPAASGYPGPVVGLSQVVYLSVFPYSYSSNTAHSNGSAINLTTAVVAGAK
jgi:branched-chain amino acid transport system substrate-binding protein